MFGNLLHCNRLITKRPSQDFPEYNGQERDLGTNLKIEITF